MNHYRVNVGVSRLDTGIYRVEPHDLYAVSAADALIIASIRHLNLQDNDSSAEKRQVVNMFTWSQEHEDWV